MNPRRRRSELSDVDRPGEPGRTEPLSRTSAVVRLEAGGRLIALSHQRADHLCGVGRDDVAPEVRDLLVVREATARPSVSGIPGVLPDRRAELPERVALRQRPPVEPHSLAGACTPWQASRMRTSLLPACS